MLPQNNFNTNSRRKVQNLCLKYTKLRFQTLHACAIMHWRTQWRTTQNCLRVEPIWIDSKNKFTPLFTRHIQLFNSKIEVLSKRNQSLDDCYCLCLLLLHGLYYRLPVCHPIKYSLSNTISPLSSKGFHCRCYVIYYAFFI